MLSPFYRKNKSYFDSINKICEGGINSVEKYAKEAEAGAKALGKDLANEAIK